VVSRGVRQVLGVEMPVFPKRRFQHGAVSAERAAAFGPRNEVRYRRHFERLHAGVPGAQGAQGAAAAPAAAS
jgi:asparagine synthase (glutamine-hydrolysing)